MEITDIVLKLIGNTTPKGCSNEDARILENVEELGKLTVNLVTQLDDIVGSRSSYESSVKTIGERAKFWLNEIGEYVE